MKFLKRSASEDDPEKKVPWLLTCRVMLAIISCFGFMCLYSMKVNMGVAMVCMVNYTHLQQSIAHDQQIETNGTNETTSPKNEAYMAYMEKCGGLHHGNATKAHDDGEFLWEKQTIGLILGSFFWGYVITQTPGGWLAGKLGGKRVFGYCMFMCSVATILVPVAARLHVAFLMVLRFIAGFSQGVVWPSMHAIWAYWAPPAERSKLIGFTFAGAQIGNVITFPLSGLLCEYGFDGGWPAIFYVLGGAGILWFIFWMILASDTPESHPRITVSERKFIQDSLEGAMSHGVDHNQSIPWGAMLTSKAVWATIIMHTGANFIIYTFMVNLPAYMKEVLVFDIKSNGLLSALPYLGMWVTIIVTGIIADYLVLHELLSLTNVRKLFNTCGGTLPSIIIVILGFLDCDERPLAVTLVILAVSLQGCCFSAGFMVNPVDIAPRYASIVFGISNTIASIPGFLAPYIVAGLTPNQSRQEWHKVFITIAIICTFANIIYLFLGSGELQEWAKDHPDVDKKKEGIEDELEDKPLKADAIEMNNIDTAAGDKKEKSPMMKTNAA